MGIPGKGCGGGDFVDCVLFNYFSLFISSRRESDRVQFNQEGEIWEKLPESQGTDMSITKTLRQCFLPL